MKKLTQDIIIAFCAILLALTIILGAVSLMAFYKDFYFSEYEKTGTYERLSEKYSINSSESRVLAQNITDNIFDYFHGKTGLDTHFDASEKSHMSDVRSVLRTINTTYYLSAALLIAIGFWLYIKYRKDLMRFIELLSKIVFYGAIIALAFLVLLFLGVVFDFEGIFVLMHLIIFPQGNWMFSQSSLLITLFSEQFFSDMALRIFTYAIIQAGVFFAIGLWMRKNVKTYYRMHR